MEENTLVEQKRTRKKVPYKKHNDGPISTYILHKPDGTEQEVKYRRCKYISPEQIQTWDAEIKSGKTRKQICADNQISAFTLRKYLRIHQEQTANTQT